MIMSETSSDELCPCGSGKNSKFCCKKNQKWFKHPQKLVNVKETGYSNQQCFASSSDDCCRKMTGEHIIPQALLKKTGSKDFYIHGANWTGKNGQKVSIPRLMAKVSCERHNFLSSPFDNELTRLFETLLKINSPEWTQSDSMVTIFSGPDLERGLLKLYLCAGASNWIGGEHGPICIKSGPKQLIDMIYKNADMEYMPGLHVFKTKKTNEVVHSIGIQFLPKADDPSAIVGFILSLLGISFAYATEHLILRNGPEFLPYSEAWRRPGKIIFQSADCEKKILFSWPKNYIDEDTIIDIIPIFTSSD